jgi:hypothetical protein
MKYLKLSLFAAIFGNMVSVQAQNANPYAHKDSIEIGRNVYGPDDRKEASIWGYADYTHATAVAVQTSQFSGNYLSGHSLGDKLLLQYKADFVSSEVAYRDQPAFGFCSGFLIAPDLLITAGHCIDKTNFRTVEWVFDYTNDITKNYKPKQSIYVNPSNRYKVLEVITSVLDDETMQDYAVLRLDRPTDRVPYSFRTSSKILPGEKVNMIGAPSGIPLKLVEGSNVVSNYMDEYFTTDLDAFGGNSGGPVYNNAGRIEGILVRGPSKGFYIDPICNCVKTSRYYEEDAKELFKGVDVQKVTDIPWYLLTGAIYDNIEYAIRKNDRKRMDQWLIYSWIKDETTVAAKTNLMLVAASNNNLDAMKLLFDKKWPVTPKDSRGRNLLRIAVDNKNTEMIDFLIKKGLNPNDKDDSGNNALFWAINNYDPTTMEYLLKKGVSTSASNSNGDYPIHAAVRQNSFMMVETLINNGADLSTTTSNGYTPRKLAKKLKYKSLKKYLKKVEKSK